MSSLTFELNLQIWTVKMEEEQELKPGDLVWFEPGIGFPLPGEIQEVHDAAQIIIIAATIDGKVKWAKRKTIE